MRPVQAADPEVGPGPPREGSAAEATRFPLGKPIPRPRGLLEKSRGLSRLPSTSSGKQHLCCILDGMDRSKFRFPRSVSVMASKDFANFARPTLDTYGVLAHGQLCLLAQSLPAVAKDSNFCCDVLAFVLHKITEAGRMDPRQCELVVQSDNCSREIKNNSLLRMLGLWVSLHRLGRAELRNLRAGHSHEDIDAWFGHLSYWLESEKELHTPPDFRDSLERFMKQPGARVDEPMKFSVTVDRVRDWILGT